MSLSAPIAVSATAAVSLPPFTFQYQFLCELWQESLWIVGEGEHFPAFRARSGSGGSAAGRQRRSSTYPQALLVNLTRCAIAEALVLGARCCKSPARRRYRPWLRPRWHRHGGR